MKRGLLVLAISLFVVTTLGIAQDQPAQRDQLSARGQERIAKEVRHELPILPSSRAFDTIAYKFDSPTATLLGQATRPALKSDADTGITRTQAARRGANHF